MLINIWVSWTFPYNQLLSWIVLLFKHCGLQWCKAPLTPHMDTLSSAWSQLLEILISMFCVETEVKAIYSFEYLGVYKTSVKLILFTRILQTVPNTISDVSLNRSIPCYNKAIAMCTEDPLPLPFHRGASLFVCGSATLLPYFLSRVGTL